MKRTIGILDLIIFLLSIIVLLIAFFMNMDKLSLLIGVGLIILLGIAHTRLEKITGLSSENPKIKTMRRMTQADFERITYITTALGYSSCTQELISEHLELACKEAERTDREFDILKDYPEYFKDENVYEQTDEWIEDFISQAPPAKRDEIRQLIKENTEII